MCFTIYFAAISTVIVVFDWLLFIHLQNGHRLCVMFVCHIANVSTMIPVVEPAFSVAR